MANILGLSISILDHDSSAAILKDGRLIAAVEEERMNRIKHYGGFPEKSIKYCLETAGLKPEDIDYVGIPFHPTVHMLKRLKFVLTYGRLKYLPRRSLFVLNLSRSSLRDKNKCMRMFPNAKIVFIEHHLAHAASAYYVSHFPEAAIFATDGRGEWTTTMLAYGEDSKIIKLKEQYFPTSLGQFYYAFTSYLGFKQHDEYKVMGLAPYGSPKYLDFFRKALKFSEKNVVDIDLSLVQHPSYAPIEWGSRYFTEKVVSELGPPRLPSEPIETRHMDIAASLQERYNEIGVEIANYLYSLTKKDYLCMAGGVALNSVMNYRIKTQTPFKDIFIQPAAGDGGLSVGCAFYIQNMILNQKTSFHFDHAYWGPESSNEEIEKELKISGVEYVELKDPSYVGAYLLKEGYIIGWFQGRTEFGPRALGNRSILADPRKAENKDIVNARIKFREEFRPFAPSVLEEYADEYFIDCNGGAAPFMLLVPPVRPGKENVIPAVTHVDKTGRAQVVSKKANPLYYSLIKHFYNFTGVPVVLNTSFNVKGEPIVNSPVDAMKCFYTTGLDFLIMHNFLLFKKPIPENIKEIIRSGKGD